MSKSNGAGIKRRLALYDKRNVIPYHAETVYDPDTEEVKFAFYDREKQAVIYLDRVKWREEEVFPQDGGPGGLLSKSAVLLPERADAYGSVDELLAEIEGFMRSYMIMDDAHYLLASRYVLLSWIADCVTSVPYLRARADTGQGKSRWLKVIGSLCYAPVFASGATTASPVFRIYDLFPRATFLFDEADWDDRSDEFSEIVKLLNCGYEKSTAVMRSQVEAHAIFPMAFDVFGPKILATRNPFKDPALESRCFTMQLKDVGTDLGSVPVNLGASFWTQAGLIRNKLLMWRFEHFTVLDEIADLAAPDIPPRLRALMAPLVVAHEASSPMLIGYLQSLHGDLQDARSTDIEGHVLEAVLECLGSINPLLPEEARPRLELREVRTRLNAHLTESGEEEMSTRKVHNTLKRINIRVKRMAKGYIVDADPAYIAQISTKFGLDPGNYADWLARPGANGNGSDPTHEGYTMEMPEPPDD